MPHFILGESVAKTVDIISGVVIKGGEEIEGYGE